MEPTELDLSQADQVLYVVVSGTATTWTPNLSECVAPGESYVWFVRAVFREEEGEVIEASEWSYGWFFSISPMPSAHEVEEALSVLRRYSGTGNAEADTAAPRRRAVQGDRTQPTETSQRRPVPSQDQKSMISAATAIKGSLSGTTGETYGVVGISASSDGTGMGAANTAGGPDLVLDGGADGGQAYAMLTQSGIDRPSGSRQVFTVQNSLGGGMTLQVDGDSVVTTLTD